MELLYPPFPAPLLPSPTQEHPSAPLPCGVELLPVISENGEVTGQASRAYLHGGSKLLHPVVHLHLVNSRGEIYLQKRSQNKDLLPGLWDTAVGGHIDYGEYVAEALYREASEELGLVDFNAFFLTSYIWESERERELVCVFAALGDFSPVPDPSEVECGKWWTEKEIEYSLGKTVLTPNFEGEFARIRKDLAALL